MTPLAEMLGPHGSWVNVGNDVRSAIRVKLAFEMGKQGKLVEE
jgi:hypothetical protein